MYRVVVWHGSNGTDARAVRSVPVMDTLGHLLIRSGQELTEIPRRSTYSMHPQNYWTSLTIGSDGDHPRYA